MASLEFPPQLVIPIGAVLAASITAAISFVSLVVSKEQKISEFRQSWIDALRQELAEFASNARRVAAETSPINLRRLSGSVVEQIEAHNQEALRADPFHENRQRLAQAYYAVRLRLNPTEPDHNSILKNLDAVYDVLASSAESVRLDRTVKALDDLARASQGVLKREWIRVKDGEPRYRRAVTVAKVVGSSLVLMFVAMLTYAIFIASREI